MDTYEKRQEGSGQAGGRSIKLNALMNLTKVAAGLVFPLITFPYVSRVLGPDGVGKVNFATSLITYFVLFAALGIPMYGIREVAKVRDDRNALRRLTQELLILHSAGAFVSLLAFSVLLLLNAQVRGEALLFLVVGLSLPLSVFTMDWFYQGLEEYAYITIRSVAFSAVSVVALFLLVDGEGDYVLNAAITVVAALGSSILNFWNARKTIFGAVDEPLRPMRHLRALGVVYVFSFVVSLYTNLDTVMLGFLSAPANVGYYSTAMKLIKLQIALVTSFGGVLLPRLTWYLANGKQEEFDLMLRKSLGVVLLLCLPVVVGLMVTSRELVLLLAGELYSEAVPCLRITAPVILSIGLTNLVGIQLLYPMGRENLVVASVGVGAIVSLILNCLLIPRFQHVGAAWAALAAECSVLAFQLVMVRKFYRLDWPFGSIARYVAGAAMVVAGALGIEQILPASTSSAMVLSAKVGAGGAGYLFVLVVSRDPFLVEVVSKLKASVHHGRV